MVQNSQVAVDLLHDALELRQALSLQGFRVLDLAPSWGSNGLGFRV